MDHGRRQREEIEGLERLGVAFVIAILVHLAALPLIPHILPPPPVETKAAEVELVKLLPEVWERNLQPAAAAARQLTPDEERAEREKARVEEERRREEEARAAAEEKKRDERPHGQVVYVGPTGDGKAPDQTRFLAEYNSKVDKETISRWRRNDYLNPLPTPSVTKEQAGGGGEGEVKAVGMALNVSRKEQPERREGLKKETPEVPRGQEFVLKIPDIRRSDEVNLALGEHGSVRNAKFSEEMKGNSDHYELKLGGGTAKEGDEEPGERLPPRIAALMPGPATLARVAGGPFADHVDDVEEGEGTFLNAKEYRYATFFNRIKKGVSQNWEPGFQLQKRDPYGNVFGQKDRLTVLKVTLDAQGNLKDTVVRKTSGIDFLDDEAIAAFQRAQPFPNPPPGLLRDGTVSFDFGFYVEFSSSNFRLFRYRGGE